MSGIEAAARRYADFWRELEPETTGRLRELAAPELRFVDPFNDLRGRDTVVAMLNHMFQSVEQVRFDITRTAVDREVAFYRWDFTCKVRGRRIGVAIAGMSEVRFDAAGLVLSHIDHWDAASQVYARLPLLGGLLRQVRRRFAFKG